MAGASIIDGTLSQSEEVVAILGVLIISGFLIVVLYRWISGGPKSPDPWDNEGFTPPDEEAAVLCHHCLVPNALSSDFCENCGAPIGVYTNYLPFTYLFSVGYLLRTGTSGDFKRTGFTVFGFVLVSLAEYTIFAPFYLYQFFKHRSARVR